MSLIPNTYDGLVSAIAALAEDDSLEFIAFIPTAIYLAEERLIKELDTEGLTATASATGTGGVQTLTKPTGYRLGHTVVVRTSAGLTTLEKKTKDFLTDYWPVTTSTSVFNNGVPKYYADSGNTTFLTAPIPASAYNYTYTYVKQLEHISAAAQTNYYTDYCADSLYYATMCNMAEFMKDFQAQPIWEKRFVESVMTQNNEGRRGRRDDSTVPANPKVNLNTLKGEN